MTVLVLTLTLAAPVQAAKTVVIVPAGAVPLQVNVGKKAQTYYQLGSSGTLRVKVDGPGKLTVMSRLMPALGSKDSWGYSVTVREKGNVVVGKKLQSGRSSATLAKAGGALGKLRKILVRVPPGSHVYEVNLGDAGKSSGAMKFLFRRAKRSLNGTSIQAQSYHRVATAVVKEKLLTHYVSTRDKGVQLRVIGPTRLTVTTRLNYDASMKGGQKYSVGVWEAGKRIKVKSLSTTKALATTYQDWKDVVPGKTATFSVVVPSGEHWYTFRLEEGMARSVSMRFSIPKKDLKNEK